MTMDLRSITEVLSHLVNIESVNPELVPGGSGEEAIARHLARSLEAAGLDVRLQEVGPGRLNVIGVLKGKGGGRNLLLNGHLDTVGVAGMDAPFTPRIENGLLYGRGAEDMKGGVAAALAAVVTLAGEPRLRGDVVFAGVADEEFKSAGTRALLASGVRADAAIVMEPTGLEVATAHKGFAWAEVETLGRAAHGSRPEEGLDAIALMGRVLVEIERLQESLSAGPRHALLGCGSIHASLISGGQELSSYPAQCRLSLERRLVPGEDGSTLHRELQHIVAKLGVEDPRFKARITSGYWAQALETPREAAIVQSLARAAQSVMGREARFGTQSFWTDAALLSEAGIPSVLFGPGGAGLHSTSEYVRLDHVLQCAETLAACARDFCGA